MLDSPQAVPQAVAVGDGQEAEAATPESQGCQEVGAGEERLGEVVGSAPWEFPWSAQLMELPVAGQAGVLGLERGVAWGVRGMPVL